MMKRWFWVISWYFWQIMLLLSKNNASKKFAKLSELLARPISSFKLMQMFRNRLNNAVFSLLYSYNRKHSLILTIFKIFSLAKSDWRVYFPNLLKPFTFMDLAGFGNQTFNHLFWWVCLNFCSSIQYLLWDTTPWQLPYTPCVWWTKYPDCDCSIIYSCLLSLSLRCSCWAPPIRLYRIPQ